MTDLFRFPHTPHLAWLGLGTPRDDKVLPALEANELLGSDVVVEEKLDGANLGISLDPSRTLRIQNRGQYLHEPYSGQFRRLGAWIAQHEGRLLDALTPEHIAFGEWCAARHSVAYERLPDWFVLFDIFDRSEARFFSTTRRNAFAARMELVTVPEVFRGRTSLSALEMRLASECSRYAAGPIEGFVIRRESGDWLTSRAKLVNPEFVQSIDQHWRRRRIEWNRLACSAGTQTSREA